MAYLLSMTVNSADDAESAKLRLIKSTHSSYSKHPVA